MFGREDSELRYGVRAHVLLELYHRMGAREGERARVAASCFALMIHRPSVRYVDSR